MVYSTLQLRNPSYDGSTTFCHSLETSVGDNALWQGSQRYGNTRACSRALHSSEMPEKAISECRALVHTIDLERRWAQRSTNLKGIRHINKREPRNEDLLPATSTPAGNE